MIAKKSEIRKAYLLNKYVIITPSRAERPRDVKEKTIVRRSSKCPFCAGNIDNENIIDKIQKGEKWQVLSIKNIFPAVTLDNKYAYGTQEVIIESPTHSKELADLNESQISNLLEMYAQRTSVISKNKKINYILCFKNQGSKAGASIVHAHSQIFATELVPPEVAEEQKMARAYEHKNKTCAYCDIIKKESKGPRKIFVDKNILAFAPFASEYHYEAWILTKKHLDNITCLQASEIKSLAHALKIILKKLQKLDLSFNFFLHNIVRDKKQHIYLKIQPRDSIWAGVELGSGLVINSISPEQAAKYYRS